MHSPRQLKRLRRNNAGAQSDSSEDEIEQVQLMDTNSEQDSEEVSGGETQQDAVKHNVHSKTKCWLFFTVPQKGMKQNLSILLLKCIYFLVLIQKEPWLEMDCKILYGQASNTM